MQTRNRKRIQYIIPDHSDDENNVGDNVSVSSMDSIHTSVTTLDSVYTPEQNMTDISDDTSYTSPTSTQKSQKNIDNMVSNINHDMDNVLNNSIVPYVGNIHTVNVHESIDHPSRLKSVNNLEKYEQCKRFIRQISNEPCFKYHTNVNSDCMCLRYYVVMTRY